jgi:hypothetical protein
MPDEPSPPSATAPRASYWRFSLGSIMLAMTILSLILGVLRVVPMSDDMRIAMFWLAGVWGVAALLFLGPGWWKYVRLQRQLEERKAEIQRWTDEQRRQRAKASSSTTAINPPSDTT